jgi:hypothetical protein
LCFVIALDSANVAPKAMSPSAVQISIANTPTNIMYYYHSQILQILNTKIFINS